VIIYSIEISLCPKFPGGQTGKFSEPDLVMIGIPFNYYGLKYVGRKCVILVLDKVTRNSIISDIISDIIPTNHVSKATLMNCNSQISSTDHGYSHGRSSFLGCGGEI
jgi:hypothetical protein